MSSKKGVSQEDPTPAAGTAVVAPQAEQPKAVAAAPSFASMVADAQEMHQDFDREDLSIPFIRVAQSLTPQTKAHEVSFIDGLKEGDLFNTVTGKFVSGREGLVVVPVTYQRSFTEWWPRDSKQGTGFVADHGSDSSVLEGTTEDEKRHNITAQGTEIVKTALYYIIVVDPATGEAQQAALALTRTQLKHARKWNALMQALRVKNPDDATQSVNPPLCYMSYKLTTTPEKKDNYSWMGIKVDTYVPTHELPNGPAIYAAAKDLLKLVSSGKVKAKLDTELGGQAAEGEGKDDLPF